MGQLPERIVCLSAESADWLWRIGAWGNVAGVTRFFRPPANASAKPRVSAFSTAQLDAISALNPDLVIAFSDVQARLAEGLIRRGFPVLATNQRTLAETAATLSLLGRIVGREAEAERQLSVFRERLAPVTNGAVRPRVYFEEWDDPLITGIAWVGELIERAGGTVIVAGQKEQRAASDRVVSSAQICRADPEIILVSWCGKPAQIAAIASRPGWADISAVRARRIYELPGENILQPGFRLIDGFEQIKELVRQAIHSSLQKDAVPPG